VINIGSIDGLKTPIFDNFSYAASKAAVHQLTRVLATHLVREHILVNAIAPGPFPTWMLSAGVGFGGKVEGQDWESVGAKNPRGRVGTPEDMAGLAIYLSSRAGAYIVGEIITCDGGAVSCG
jgi:2-deoxy-D-gluconate 3-dehydrogenase